MVLVEGYISSIQHVAELSGSPVQVMLELQGAGTHLSLGPKVHWPLPSSPILRDPCACLLCCISGAFVGPGGMRLLHLGGHGKSSCVSSLSLNACQVISGGPCGFPAQGLISVTMQRKGRGVDCAQCSPSVGVRVPSLPGEWIITDVSYVRLWGHCGWPCSALREERECLTPPNTGSVLWLCVRDHPHPSTAPTRSPCPDPPFRGLVSEAVFYVHWALRPGIALELSL